MMAEKGFDDLPQGVPLIEGGKAPSKNMNSKKSVMEIMGESQSENEKLMDNSHSETGVILSSQSEEMHTMIRDSRNKNKWQILVSRTTAHLGIVNEQTRARLAITPFLSRYQQYWHYVQTMSIEPIERRIN